MSITKTQLLIITRHFSPILNGPSIVLSRLVKHWPQKSVSIFTRDFSKSFESIDPTFMLNMHVKRIPWDGNLTRIDRVKEFINIRKLVKGICDEALLRKSNIILGVTDDGPFFIASYLAAKKLRIPLVLYMLDLYEEGRRSRLQKFFAKRFEKSIFKSASAVLVMSERMKEHYKQKYNIESTVIYHPIEAEEIVDIPRQEGKRQPLQVIFTGHITAAQAGSIMDLVGIIRENHTEFSLKLCVPERKFFKNGLPSNAEIISLDRKEVLKAQRDADVLFLPYAFNNPYEDIIRTASPSKLPEYLAAGRPILYYGPEDSYVNWYLNETKSALCVTRSDRNDLLKALRRLRDDHGLRDRLSKNAIEAARSHDSTIVADQAWQILRKALYARARSEKKPPVYWLTNEHEKPITGGELRYYEHINYLRSAGWQVKCFPIGKWNRVGQLLHGIRLGLILFKKPSGIIVQDISLRDIWLFLNPINRFRHNIVTFALEFFPDSENKVASRFLFNRYFHNVHSIIVASKFMKDWVVKMGAKHAKIYIVPDAGRVKGTGFCQKSLNNPVRILCVAHIRSTKGQEILLKSLSMLPRETFQVRFAGYVKEPAYKIKLMEFVKKNHLEDEVVWLGMLKKEELTKEYEAADIFVLPTYREGFGQVILEAMSFCLPVITSKVGATPELIEHMKSGILIDAGNPKQIVDMINLLYSNQKLMNSISENAYTEAIKYGDWNDINSKFENVMYNLRL